MTHRDSASAAAPVGLRLYNSSGEIEHHSNLAEFDSPPANALALKFTDALADGRWITEGGDLRRLRTEDAPLVYTAAGLAALGIDAQ